MEFLKHALIQGETLPELAQRYNGDASKWIDIAVYNKLAHPYVVWEPRNDSTPKNVKAIGEVLMIPVEDATESLDTMERFEIDDAYDRLLGEDLSIFPLGSTVNLLGEGTGEFDFDKRGDLQTVRGIHNLKQSLILRLSTPIGALLHHPDYGTQLLDFVGKAASYEEQQKIKIEVERTIRTDSRVSDVTNVMVSYSQGKVDISVDLVAIGIEEIINLGLKIGASGVIEWG